MSWIRDTGEDLVNLEHVQQMELVALEVEDIEDDAFGVMATLVNGETVIICTGEEAACREKLEHIAEKLPMVRV